jgi:hypothetical protein
MSESDKDQEVEVQIIESAEKQGSHASGKKAGESVGKAINSFMDTLEVALAGRGNSVMVRVNDEALEKLDMLVASGICKSRSESAAFLLQRGIECSAAMFNRISDVTSKITDLRQELLDWVQEEAKER